MCIYVYARIYIGVYMYTYVHVPTYIYTHRNIHTYIYTYIYIYLYKYISRRKQVIMSKNIPSRIGFKGSGRVGSKPECKDARCRITTPICTKRSPSRYTAIAR